MRIAVVQLHVRADQRTVTLQRALRAIDVAAEAEPAPDLVLLPAFCDVPAVLVGLPAITEHCSGPAVAACGHRARQWGVFVALGFAETGASSPFLTGVLLDRDGDVRLSHRQRRFDSAGQRRFTPGETLLTVDVLFGRIALLTGEDVLDGAAWDAAARAGAGLVLSSGCRARPENRPAGEAGGTRRRIAEQAARCSIPCAIADVTTANDPVPMVVPGISTLVDGRGKTISSAEPGRATTLWGEVELSPPREHSQAYEGASE